VDREKLLGISGRSRKEQMDLAAELDVTNYPCPAGGCLLTEVSFVPKIRDVFAHTDELNLRDFRMLKMGRHFRIGPRTKLLIGRDEAENTVLEHAVQGGDTVLRWLDGSSPTGVITGERDDALLETAARILLRYTKAEQGEDCSLKVVCDEEERFITVAHRFDDQAIEPYRI
jgi:hypothetical protein